MKQAARWAECDCFLLQGLPGTFPGGEDPTPAPSTALSVTTEVKIDVPLGMWSAFHRQHVLILASQ